MKTVYITGASGGIGRATAELFAQKQYAVAFGYWSQQESAHQFCKELSQRYETPVLPVYGDLRNLQGCRSACSLIHKEFSRVDVLIHNAGTALRKLLTDTSEQEWADIRAIHLDSAFYLTKELLPEMISRHSGRILLVSSMWGQVGASMEVAYSTVKAGLIGFTKALAKEVGPSGITVNCVAPGVIQTSMNQFLSKEEKTALEEEIPLCRFGTPEEVAKVLLFLADEESTYITGQVIGVNGGMVL